MNTDPNCFTHLPNKSEREKDVYYIYKEDIVFWDGKILKCEHKRIRSTCKECGGSQICQHDKVRSQCKECGGSQICQHNRERSRCKECGGSQICQHDKRRLHCKECGGSGICQHNRIRSTCKICDPTGHLTVILRSRVYKALKSYNNKKEQKTLEYLGCTLGELKTYLETKFEEGMTWENQGEWHIDHIKPCASFNLDNEEEIAQCFHFSNLQPLWGEDNLIKHDFYNDDMEWTEDNGWMLK